MKKWVPVLILCVLTTVMLGADSETKTEVKPKISPDGYAWVALQVADVDEAAKFFKEKLNFKGEKAGEYYLFQVSDDAYLVLLKKQSESAKSDGAMVSFHIKDVDAYFEQVTGNGVKAIDYLEEGKEMSKPVWRDWGSKEFGVMGPENTILVFTRLG